MKIEGDITFAEIPTPFTGATVVVRVEDTRRADAPATVIAEQRIAGVFRVPGNLETIPFSIECPPECDLSGCSLRVHVDVDGTGEVSRGDYVSMQSYPLAGGPSRLNVTVKPVK